MHAAVAPPAQACQCPSPRRWATMLCSLPSK
jgi:hypothetical protein